MFNCDSKTESVKRPRKPPPTIRILVVALAALAVVWMPARCSASAAGTASDPAQMVESTVDRVIALLKDRSTPKPQRRQELLKLVERHFDFQEMARAALGFHWRGLSEPQRKEYVALFVAFLEDAYVNKIESYSGQPIQVLKATPLGDDQAEVNTNILQTGRDPVQINYVLKNTGGEWKVHDVNIDAVSIVANYRNQFSRVINRQGLDALMEELREKRRQLEASLK